MGIASLVLGICTVFCSLIPFFNYIAVLPALIGLSLGIAELLRLRLGGQAQAAAKGFTMAGVSLNSIALFSILSWTLYFSSKISELRDAISFNRLAPDFLLLEDFFSRDFFDPDSYVRNGENSKKRDKEEQKDSWLNPFAKKNRPSIEEQEEREERGFKWQQHGKKPYFKKEFKSEGPGSFHWRFERRYEPDNKNGLSPKEKQERHRKLQENHRKFIEEFRKDIQKHFHFNVPKDLQKHFDFGSSSKFRKKRKNHKKDLEVEEKKSQSDHFEKEYKEVI